MAPPRQRRNHIVAPGDHLSRVAVTNGFRSYVPLWDDPANAPLQKLRKTPHVLADGDPVDIPPLEAREVERPTEHRHRFKATIPELLVRVKHLTWAGAPIAAPTAVLADGKSAVANGKAGSIFEIPIGPIADRLLLTVEPSETLLRVGFLQPVSTLAGSRERLTNLGYEAGEKNDATNLQFRSAVEEFQCDQHLVIDGKVGPDTRARLVKVHGC